MTEVEFGKYPQDPEAYVNGKRISIVDRKPQFNPLEQQPIKWLVLVEEQDKMLLLSEYALEYMPFNAWDTFDVTWANSTLRGWLNGEIQFDGDFLNDHLSEDEKKRIIPHAETNDCVFLLSLDETLQYLPSNHGRRCLPTAYAVSRLPETYKYSDGDTCHWWLRTFSEDNNRYTMAVNRKGMYDRHGFKNNMHGVGVRPALWIKK